MRGAGACGGIYRRGDAIAELYEQREFNKAIREIVALADRANQYIDEKKPWVLAKQEGTEQEVHDVCSVGINLFRVLMTYLKPVLPAMAEKAEAFLNCSLDWTALEAPLLAHQLAKFKPLMTRIEASRWRPWWKPARTPAATSSRRHEPDAGSRQTALPSNSRISPKLT